MTKNEQIEYLKQTLKDIRDGKDNPCYLVDVALLKLEGKNEIH